MKYRSITLNSEQLSTLRNIMRWAKLNHTMWIKSSMADKTDIEVQEHWNFFWDKMLPIECAMFEAMGHFVSSKICNVYLLEPSFLDLQAILSSMDTTIASIIAVDDNAGIAERIRAYYPQILEAIQDAGVNETDVRAPRISGKINNYAN